MQSNHLSFRLIFPLGSALALALSAFPSVSALADLQRQLERDAAVRSDSGKALLDVEAYRSCVNQQAFLNGIEQPEELNARCRDQLYRSHESTMPEEAPLEIERTGEESQWYKPCCRLLLA